MEAFLSQWIAACGAAVAVTVSIMVIIMILSIVLILSIKFFRWSLRYMWSEAMKAKEDVNAVMEKGVFKVKER